MHTPPIADDAWEAWTPEQLARRLRALSDQPGTADRSEFAQRKNGALSDQPGTADRSEFAQRKNGALSDQPVTADRSEFAQCGNEALSDQPETADRSEFAQNKESWSVLRSNLIAEHSRGAPTGWYVAGGWALDLWRGEQTRAHEDLEFVVPEADLDAFRAALQPGSVEDISFWTAHDGVVSHLPAGQQVPAHIWQVWCLDEAAGCWRADMMIDRGPQDRWAYKRNPAISAPRADMIRLTPAGIPYLAPAAVLLFKAKYCREKDEADFAMAAPRLRVDERAQLRAWLDMEHPGHPWRDAL